jgi:hypothetical protein
VSSTLLNELRAYLIAQGIGRDPRVAGSLPPIWRQPRDGVPAPGQGSGAEVGATAVVGLFVNGGYPSAPMEGFLERRSVDIRLRTSHAQIGEQIGVALAVALDDRRYYLAGALRVHESLMERPLQLLASDAHSFDYVTSYVFLVRREELAAL